MLCLSCSTHQAVARMVTQCKPLVDVPVLGMLQTAVAECPGFSHGLGVKGLWMLQHNICNVHALVAIHLCSLWPQTVKQPLQVCDDTQLRKPSKRHARQDTAVEAAA